MSLRVPGGVASVLALVICGVALAHDPQLLRGAEIPHPETLAAGVTGAVLWVLAKVLDESPLLVFAVALVSGFCILGLPGLGWALFIYLLWASPFLAELLVELIV